MFVGRSRHLRDRGDLGVPAAHRVPGPVRRAPGGQTGAVTQQPVFTIIFTVVVTYLFTS